METPETSGAPRRPGPAELPAAALRLWIAGEGSAPAWQAATSAVHGEAGVTAVSPGVFVVLPLAGDPAVFDAALRLGENAQRRAPELRALVHPIRVRAADSSCEPLEDPLSRDLERLLPDLAPGHVHLTSRSSQMLEHPPEIGGAEPYRGPSGRSVPIVQAGRAIESLRPWRNRELFGRSLPMVYRSRPTALLAELLAEPAGAIVGPLGSGKSRLVWDRLREIKGTALWAAVEPDRAGRYSLAEQIVHRAIALTTPHRGAALRDGVFEDLEAWRRDVRLQNGESTIEGALKLLDRLAQRAAGALYIVVDDLAQASAPDLELVARLRTLAEGDRRFRLLVIGRSVENGLDRLPGLPTLELQPMEEAEIDRVCAHAVEGLSLPTTVRKRFLEAAAGYPFALEEGLLALIHGRSLRRVYGSFFFGGGDDATYEPSERLTRHLLSEAGRLQAIEPARLLALLEEGVPPAALDEASTHPAANGWDSRLLAARLLRRTDTPWGVGLDFECAAYRAALRDAIPGDTAGEARRRLGRKLSSEAASGEAQWRAYQLLQGSPGGIEPLLAADRGTDDSAIPRKRLLATLTRELAAHRARRGSLETELDLLWRILPLARRLGQLHDFVTEMARAIDLCGDDSSRLLALATLKAEVDRDAGRFQEAERTIHRALKAASGDDRRRQALLLVQLGRLFVRQRRFDEAERLFVNLLEAVVEDRLTALAATCRFFLGNIARQEGRLADAFDHHRKALEERRGLGLERAVGSSLCALGATAISAGNFPQALTYYRRALHVLVDDARDGEISFALLGLGNVFSRLGDYTGASRPLRRALELREDRDDVKGEAVVRLALAANHLDLGWPESALELAKAARFQLRLASAEELLADCEQLLGRIRHKRRELGAARVSFRDAEAMHRELGDLGQAALDRSWRLEIALEEDDVDGIGEHAAELRKLVGELKGHDAAEVLEFRLFRALDKLRRLGEVAQDPLAHLERAYRRLLARAAHLTPPQRHRFLQQIPIHGEIVRAATGKGLPDLVAGGGKEPPGRSTGSNRRSSAP